MGQPQLQVGMETLAKAGDGRYYVGDVLKIDDKKERCLINFETGAEIWVSFSDIQNALVGGPDITCSLCRKGTSLEPNEIVLCDLCGLGFHQLCHNPEITTAVLEPDVEWVCRLCGAVRDTNMEEATSTSEHSYTAAKSVPKTFTYEVDRLHWDDQHLTNKQNKYCYCGQPGNWYIEMVECRKCRQWFHQECVDGFPYNLVWADRCHVFVCSPCNGHQGEYLQRLEIGWDEVVHLSIFHLTMERHIKYFDVNEVIVPWIVKNFHRFHLQKSVLSTPRSQIKDAVLHILESERTKKYKSGREIKKRFSWWGLRDRVPPPPPALGSLPSGPLSADTVTAAIKGGVNKWRKVHDYRYPSIPFKLIKKRKASTDGTELLGTSRPKKPRKLSLGKTGNKVESAAPDTPTALHTDLKQFLATNQTSESSSASASPAKISLDHIIPRPESFAGLDHPFKTILERDQELASARLRERLLGVEEDSTGSDSPAPDSAPPAPPREENRPAAPSFPRIKRRKRGRPSKAELLALEARVAAAVRLGTTALTRGVDAPQPPLPRPKNVVDKTTLDGMSQRQVSLTQLRTSVSAYFGAANRLATGEGFRVLARRVTALGHVQYLVEWEGGIIG